MTDVSEIAERAFAVALERESWKTSVPSILQMQANAAALTREIFGASSFGGSSRGVGFGVAREAEACRGGDVGGDFGACAVVSNEILPSTQSINGL